MQVKRRDLGGKIRRAEAVFVWVPFATVGEDEVGIWLSVSKSSAREVIDAAGAEETDIEVNEKSDEKNVYIGMGPDPS